MCLCQSNYSYKYPIPYEKSCERLPVASVSNSGLQLPNKQVQHEKKNSVTKIRTGLDSTFILCPIDCDKADDDDDKSVAASFSV